MRKSPERCIYCDKPGKLTKEHIFGKWMGNFVPPDARATLHLTEHSIQYTESGDPIVVMGKGRFHNSANTHGVQLKLVCKSCNEIWMSCIQNDAKPHLTALMAGRWPVLDIEAIKKIVAWATMVTICLEYGDDKTRATTDSERAAFFREKLPADNWQVYLGLCNVQESPGAFMHAAALAVKLSENRALTTQPRPNAQTTTFNIGGAFFHLVSAPSDLLFNAGEYAADCGIKKLWPLPEVSPTTTGVFSTMGIRRVHKRFWDRNGLSFKLAEPRMLDPRQY